MACKNFDVGDLVWAKMKGYPPWPAIIAERTKPPLKKKNHSFVYFFGSKNNAWIPDEHITPHCQSKIDNYENKKTLPALRVAIDEIVEFSKPLLPTSTSDAEAESSDEVNDFEDVDSSSSDDIEAVLMTRNDESLKPGPSKRIGKNLTMKFKKGMMPQIKKKSSFKKKDCTEKKTVHFETDLKPKSQATMASRSNEKLKSPKILKPKAAVPVDKEIPDDDVPESDFIRLDTQDDDVPEPDFIRLDTEDDDDASDFIRLDVEENVMPARPKRHTRRHPQPTDKRIGFLGLGVMGINIVHHLLRSGHKVIAWDRNVRKLIDNGIKGANEGLSPTDVTEQSDIIFSCFYDSTVINYTVYEDVGILHGLGGCDGTKSYVEMTSVGEQKSKDIAEVVKKRGGKYLEAQINGSIDSAENGDLIIFASGDKEVYDSCYSVFHAIALHTFYTGPEVGDASSMNTLCNMFAGSVSAALAEGMSLADRVGLPKFDVMKGLGILGLNGPMIAEQGAAIITNRFDSSYFLKVQQRDMNLGLQLGNVFSHVMPVTAAANQSLIHARRCGFKPKDSSTLYMATKL